MNGAAVFPLTPALSPKERGGRLVWGWVFSGWAAAAMPQSPSPPGGRGVG